MLYLYTILGWLFCGILSALLEHYIYFKRNSDIKTGEILQFCALGPIGLSLVVFAIGQEWFESFNWNYVILKRKSK